MIMDPELYFTQSRVDVAKQNKGKYTEWLSIY